MKRIIYTSISENADTSVCENILETSRKNNPSKGITGMLMYGDGMFIQILEGPETAIDELSNTIKADQRHHSFELLYEESIEQPTFSGWSMAYKVLDNNSVARLGGKLEAQDKDDLVSFLRGDPHFVKNFIAQCAKEIADAA